MRKHERIEALISELAGTFISERSTGKALLTVVGSKLSDDFARADVFVSVFPHEHAREAEQFLMRQAGDFRNFLHERSRMGKTPFITFVVGETPF